MLHEVRSFKPDIDFSKSANLTENDHLVLRHKAKTNPEEFWKDLATAKLKWDVPFVKTLEWNPPFAKWFVGGKLNASVQCLDRHVESGNGDKLALKWEGEPTDTNGSPLEKRNITYSELLDEVARLAQGFKDLGMQTGDRVAIYLPMIPESVATMLACARIGATHTVIFGGFAAESLRDRIVDASAKFVVTANGGFRRGKALQLKDTVDKALIHCPSVSKVVVVDRLGETQSGPYATVSSRAGTSSVNWVSGRDVWYHEILSTQKMSPVSVSSEHPLFILYTSGTTGKPKGVVHSTAGYLLWTQSTTEWVFDLKPEDIHWCTADIGWITGHSYVVYGPLAAGASVFIYEGAPDFPDFHRFWQMIERQKITIFYTAPTAIRGFMRQGEAYPNASDLSSLRILGSVGEPINPEAWMWYHRTIGKEKRPIVDTWWQTETGGILISPLPGSTVTKPGSATFPLPGIDMDIIDENGESAPAGTSGKLVIKSPWPSQLSTVFGDSERYKKQYWSEICGPEGFQKQPYYFTGDGAVRDEEGYFWITGRIDDVMNVSGHRLGSMEIESALVSHHYVAEAAAVGVPDDIKGTAVFAFVTVKKEFREMLTREKDRIELIQDLRTAVVDMIGGFARPEHIRFTDALPKTRSAKIMRRLLRDIAAGKDTLGDTTTLEDLSVLSSLQHYKDDE